MNRYLIRYTLVPLAFLLTACGGGSNLQPGDEQSGTAVGDVNAEAYLFDAQVTRDKKQTSFRLDIYQTDSIIAITGRGYLGKGALRGWLRSDSIRVIFPSTKEYLYEAVDQLFKGFDCVGDIPDMRLFDLFSTLPDSLPNPPTGMVSVDYADRDRVAYVITRAGCPWKLRVTYDRQSVGWRVKEFEFTDGHDNVLSATRRIYKSKAAVPANRFYLTVPPSFTRIIP